MAKQRAIRQHKQQSYDSVLFEQYKILVESAEKVSFKRTDVNRFYLTINTLLLGSTGYLSTLRVPIPTILISVASILVAINWIRMIASYKKLNSAKFQVIHEMEQQLPVPMFSRENEYLKKKKYFGLANIEKTVPWIFLILHAVVIVIAVLGII